MKKVFVRKIFPYDSTFDGEFSRYDGYDLITLRKLDPGISSHPDMELPESMKPVCVFCSDLRRGKETAGEIAKNLDVGEVVPLDLLREVKFDIKKLLTREEFEKEGSNLVRQRFVSAFIDDALEESRDEIKARMDKFINQVRKLPGGNYLVIGHSFFMKILETYRREPNLFENPSKLVKHLDVAKRTYDYGRGFDFEVD
ncbi:MAG: hypothetical protein UV74_C0013G0149 [Candidatus Woesebacteria bacterium GW2011_GWB1_43_14]|uniref:Phosphoglycerate mutase n=1 Tax=Candidatus Woesebacteria bacterium GW2011_GWB1_43_14 TaxID=1618578 RepID=A0A0G1DHF5_9BACT|nr:MAG: hypothetical protein UV51_C0005G0072 [Candidatus Woesebacteria bacterium GW2011_GWC1_42_9]KKS97027.1 MAG: hypothetical protein UV74_C0013G0149 [Candidatus Woesebacteria bacterium GW2011_GWB1_43_14]